MLFFMHSVCLQQKRQRSVTLCEAKVDLQASRAIAKALSVCWWFLVLFRCIRTQDIEFLTIYSVGMDQFGATVIAKAVQVRCLLAY